MVQVGGLEPPTSGSTDQRSNQLSYTCTAVPPDVAGEPRFGAPVWQAVFPLPAQPGGQEKCLIHKAKARARARASLTRAAANAAHDVAGQAALPNTLVKLSLIGAAVSVATFCASSLRSLTCAVMVSNCLRIWAVESSTTSA